MKVNMYSIYDSKTKTFSPPFPDLRDESAIRQFSEQCLDPQNNLSKYSMDYTLFTVGTYDDEMGQMNSAVPTELITADNAIANMREEQLRQHTNITKRLQAEVDKIEALNDKLKSYSEDTENVT